MEVHYLNRTQRLPIPQDVAWAFFANVASLASLTPEWVNFRDVSPIRNKEVFPGQLCVFEMRPMNLFLIRWLAEITHVDAPRSFTDQQKQGPFKFWNHCHTIKPIEGGVEIIDDLHYVLPVGPLGEMGAGLARQQLQLMFDHRARQLEEYFGSMPAPPREKVDPERGLGRWKP